MIMKDFLQAVLPDKGTYFVLEASGQMRQKACSSVDEMIAATNAGVSRQHDTYYAMCSFRDKSSRKKTNALYARSAWLDLDCGPKKEFPTQKDALAALKNFLVAASIPPPTYIISSGNGVHVYWAFTENVQVNTWAKVAGIWKALLDKHEFRADPSRTADISSILRIPGSVNFKDPDNPKEVTVWRTRQPMPYDTWAKAVLVAAKEAGVSKPTPREPASESSLNSDLTGGMEEVHRPSDAERVADKCATIGAMRDTLGAEQPEPLWYACLGVLAYTEQGDEICHEWSKGHDDYDRDATQAKIDAWRSAAGPTTCEYMRGMQDNACEGCTLKCTSPIVLGHPEAQHAAYEVTADGTMVDLPSIPDDMRSRYLFDPERGGLQEMVEDREGNRFPVTICSPFPAVMFAYRDDSGDHYLRLRTRVQPGVIEESDIELGAVGQGGTSLSRELARKAGIVAVSEHQRLGVYVKTWYDNTRKNMPLQNMRRQMGWQSDGTFVLGFRTYHEDGTVTPCAISKELVRYAEGHQVQGTLKKQVQLIREIYARPHYEPYQFVLASSLGAILLPLIHNEWLGIPISLWEPDGGRGKTTVCLAAVSFWGNHNAFGQSAIAGQMTEYAATVMAGVRHHLPTMIDETTDWEPKRIAKFAYDFASGVAKLQGQADGGLRDNSTRNWQTCMFLTGNTSLISKIEANIPNPGARISRIFEIEMMLPELKLDVTDNERVRELLHNYGNIGTEFISHVVKHRKEVAAYTQKVLVSLQKEVDNSTDARFWLMAAACAIAANRIATKLGLFHWDTHALEAWTKKQVRKLRGIKNDLATDPNEILSTLVNELRPGYLITNIWGGYKTMALFDHNFPPPRNQEYTGRYITDTRDLFIPVSVVKKWCAEHNIPQKTLQENLEKGDWLKETGVKKCLTTGTKLAGSGQTRCWHLRFKEDEAPDLEDDLKFDLTAEEVMKDDGDGTD